MILHYEHRYENKMHKVLQERFILKNVNFLLAVPIFLQLRLERDLLSFLLQMRTAFLMCFFCYIERLVVGELPL